jgi:putative photosynthetic complex assembly protein 2
MAEIVLVVVYAVFAWWLSTGVVILLANLPVATYRWTMIGASVLLAIGLYGLWAYRADTSVTGAYAGFTCGLLVWAWMEVSFYTGYVTGPRTVVCEPGCKGLAHFGHAVQASLYHEIAILIALAAVIALTSGEANQVGLWTFVVLLVMHESARLNVLLGVQNLSEEFVPEHLAFLRGFLTKKSMNLLFPISITTSTVVGTLLVQRAAAPSATAFDTTAYTFLTAMLVLGILEHWFLVVPLPSGKLWAWSIAPRDAARAEAGESDTPLRDSRPAPQSSHRTTTAVACDCRTAAAVGQPAAGFPGPGFPDRVRLTVT